MPQNKTVRDLVARAHRELFDERDIGALDRYFSPDFIEHSPLVADGLTGLQELVQTHPKLRHETHRILQDGDLVAIHGRFTGLNDHPLVGFDIYRVADNKIVEHWDGLVPEAAHNASGRTQLDGPTEPGAEHDREKNRAFIIEYFTHTLIESDYTGFRRYTDGKRFLQHSPDIADGIEEVISFLEKLKAEGNGLEYDRIHRTVADGQFVLTHSEGRIAGARHAYFELWRMENGRLAEMWDAITPVPEDNEAKHGYGIF
ncbi:nuclear transport factor 2 family protein [Xenorhabdus sp. 42]|uniref:nuclear transport factor 2 family protein n=1 Tax=Xenorhabdus szentirmaii TaxID=290112 RepID=UPI001997A210|nr:MULTISPECIES: nuclear transport factor 2 family protein [unclassified Xenorhabdus]MBD2794157.1 nuclear transport factor 2 family protein [Xenorhabdus sp. CUL]MBD2822857.1 nuclear transport factor 2 family protein [Xenorhabdus sp. 42]MBD2823405.1 nuclear transport factor 2 family protein [Xenorhabdus sp. 5]